MKKNLFMMVVAAALVSCSTNDGYEPDMTDGSLISLKSVTYSAGAETRAPFEGAISSTNALTALVPSATATATETGKGSYTSPNLNTGTGTMTFNSSSAATYNLESLEATGKETFSIGDEIYLFGAYPATGWTLAVAEAKYEFTGKEDVMAAGEVLVTKDDVKAGTFQTLAFKHLLTKLEVKFKVESSATSAVGKIKSVQWVGGEDTNDTNNPDLNNQVTFTPASATATFVPATSAVKLLPFYQATETGGVKSYSDNAYTGRSYEPTTTSVLQAYAMVAPVTASVATTKEYFLKVVRELSTGDKTDYIPFDLMKTDNTTFTGSTAGNAFSVVVNYTKDDIKAVATVTAWVENGEYIANTPTE